MIFKILFFGFLCFIGWAIYVADMGQENVVFDFVKSVPYGDKVGHFFLMGILAMLANLALGYRSFALGSWSLWLGSVLILILVIGEELTQIYVPSRTFDLGDLIADFLGIALFSWFGSQFLCQSRAAACEN